MRDRLTPKVKVSMAQAGWPVVASVKGNVVQL